MDHRRDAISHLVTQVCRKVRPPESLEWPVRRGANFANLWFVPFKSLPVIERDTRYLAVGCSRFLFDRKTPAVGNRLCDGPEDYRVVAIDDQANVGGHVDSFLACFESVIGLVVILDSRLSEAGVARSLRRGLRRHAVQLRATGQKYRNNCFPELLPVQSDALA